MVRLIKEKMEAMSPGAHDDDNPVPPPHKIDARTGAVNVAAGDSLNVRDEASGKSPVVRVLHRGDTVSIVAEVKNGDTLWYELVGGDYVSAKFVTLT